MNTLNLTKTIEVRGHTEAKSYHIHIIEGIKIPKYTIKKIFLNNKMNINREENIESILIDMIDLNTESRWRLDKLKISLEKSRKENEELRYKNTKLEEKCIEYLRNNRYLDKKVYGDTVNFEGVSFHINDSEKAKAQLFSRHFCRAFAEN